MVTLTWKGTASLILDCNGERIAFDPFIELNDCEHRNSLEDFRGLDHIFITHGHLDHIYSLPEILPENHAVLHCGRQTIENLGHLGYKAEAKALTPGSVIETERAVVTAWQGRHIAYDRQLLLKTFASPQMLRHFGQARELGRVNRLLPENGETFVYLVETGGLRILVLGSLSLAEEVAYPTETDYLILPFQGNTRVREIALGIVEKLRPRQVIVDHFDNAFPPISAHVDPAPFVESMRERYPQIEVTVPEFGVEKILS